MKNIEIKVLNPEAATIAEKTMVAAARLTQRGHKINNMDDFMELYDKPFSPELVKTLCDYPHPTIQKFEVINIMVIGLSRRALAQLTRHQNEVKFMAGSLQYSNYKDAQRYVLPGLNEKNTEIIEDVYTVCSQAYDSLIKAGVSPDDAGYVLPQGFRTCLLISATAYQWKHMIGQRVCHRNTEEVRHIMLRCYEALYEISPLMFAGAGPSCASGACLEGKLSCGERITNLHKELEAYYED